MAYFAHLDDNNIVTQVSSVSNNEAPDPAPTNSEPAGQSFIASLGLTGTWIQTSYNGNIRKNYAGVGYTFDAARDAFIPPQPFPSWTLNDATCLWEPPVPYPDDGGIYTWDEATQSWLPVT